MQGPAPVVDEDGLENILVHVIGINGEWLWSSVVPEHLRMDELQRMFQMSDRTRFGRKTSRKNPNTHLPNDTQYRAHHFLILPYNMTYLNPMQH